jgi:hypothetical protein
MPRIVGKVLIKNNSNTKNNDNNDLNYKFIFKRNGILFMLVFWVVTLPSSEDGGSMFL